MKSEKVNARLVVAMAEIERAVRALSILEGVEVELVSVSWPCGLISLKRGHAEKQELWLQWISILAFSLAVSQKGTDSCPNKLRCQKAADVENLSSPN